MKKNIIIVGPNPDLFGGIAQYISGILNSSLSEDYNLLHCETGIGKSRNLSIFSAIKRMANQLYIMVMMTKNMNIDIIHIHTASWRSFWRYSIFILAAKLLGKKTLLHMHGAQFKEFYHGRNSIGRYMIRSVLGMCTSMILLSKFWKDFFDNIVFHVKMHIVEPTVELHQDSNDFVDLLESRYETDTVNVLYFGGLTERKGLKVVMKVAAILQGQGNINFIVAGAVHKSELSLLRALMKTAKEFGEKFILRANVTHAEKSELFSTSHIYILPSYSEGLPATLMEAMSFQLPVITTSVGSIPEVVGDENGILTEPGDYRTLAEAVVYLSENVELRKEMGLRNRAKVLKDYNYQEMFQKIGLIYKDLIVK